MPGKRRYEWITSRLCLTCGKNFAKQDAVVQSNLRDGQKYCSQACMTESYRGTPEDFWAKVDRRGPDECWPWKAATFKKKGKQMGYGRHAGSGPYTYAHRCAWIFTHGPIPEGRLVMHACDNVLCCNPAHLSLGTDLDNSLDMRRKGRHAGKFTEAQILEIRRKSAEGKTDRELAAEFGTVPRYIWGIRTRRNWKHLPLLDIQQGKS